MTDGQLERRSRHGPVLPKELEEVLEVCHELEVEEERCISPLSDGMNQKWNRQSSYLQSEGSELNTADSSIASHQDTHRWTLETVGDDGRRNNGLGPFYLELWRNKAGAWRTVILRPFPLD